MKEEFEILWSAIDTIALQVAELGKQHDLEQVLSERAIAYTTRRLKLEAMTEADTDGITEVVIRGASRFFPDHDLP